MLSKDLKIVPALTRVKTIGRLVKVCGNSGDNIIAGNVGYKIEPPEDSE